MKAKGNMWKRNRARVRVGQEEERYAKIYELDEEKKRIRDNRGKEQEKRR